MIIVIIKYVLNSLFQIVVLIKLHLKFKNIVIL